MKMLLKNWLWWVYQFFAILVAIIAYYSSEPLGIFLQITFMVLYFILMEVVSIIDCSKDFNN